MGVAACELQFCSRKHSVISGAADICSILVSLRKPSNVQEKLWGPFWHCKKKIIKKKKSLSNLITSVAVGPLSLLQHQPIVLLPRASETSFDCPNTKKSNSFCFFKFTVEALVKLHSCYFSTFTLHQKQDDFLRIVWALFIIKTLWTGGKE